MVNIINIASLLISLNATHLPADTVIRSKEDTLKKITLHEFVISASRISENIMQSPVSIEQLKSIDAKKLSGPGIFDVTENIKGVQVITPSLGFKVLNTRGFANTTNVRFTQLIDGIDNQAPHIGAPVANALGANDLDIDKIEIIPGTASALYGMNTINGLVNIRTRNPFVHEGLSVQQLTGTNHIGHIDKYNPRLFSQTNVRWAKALSKQIAFKVNGSTTQGRDWVADNENDLAPSLNNSTNLTGPDNPAYDEVNSYGNESPNRRSLTLNGKKYIVARTGYREQDIDDYKIENYKADAGIYYRPKAGHELSATYKGALINNLYQRANRFRLQDYTLHQYSIDYNSELIQAKTYLTQENTGHSYNIRSLAENMDRAFKTDNEWFANYTTAFNKAISEGLSVTDAHKAARTFSDEGRFAPGTDSFNSKKDELIHINNWDKGAALRVRSYLTHSEGVIQWDKLNADFFEKAGIQALSGIDYRKYIIIPDGNYFINPVDSAKNLTYSKAGGFLQINKMLLDRKLKIGATLRVDKADYFSWKYNPRFTAIYSPIQNLSLRGSYQSGYRFPSIFEGFSNINSGGVKRVGGLKIMSDGIFENSYTKASIEAFQSQVNRDINTNGLTQDEAISKNKNMLQKNPYTYLKPEHVQSLEFGCRGIILKNSLYLDADFYYNIYRDFIAQVEASIPKTSSPDSVAYYLYNKSKQSPYRLWTNSQSKVYNYGTSLGIRYSLNERITLLGNVTYTKLKRIDHHDGLEDGFNTPSLMLNSTIIVDHVYKNLGFSLTGRYQNKFNYVSFLVSGTVPSYLVFDASVNYNFEKAGFFLKAGATNLLNKTYYSILGGAKTGGLYYISLTYFLQNKKSKQTI